MSVFTLKSTSLCNVSRNIFAMKIYTKTGDKGKTALFDGTRVFKSNPRVDTYGTIDELNSYLGVVIAGLDGKLNLKNLHKELFLIQSDLFEIGALLANPHTEKKQIENVTVYFDKRVSEIENLLDTFSVEMPPITQFILPGGGKTGALLQFARTLARKCERKIVSLSQSETIEPAILCYFNRLSDLLFTMGRYANHVEQQKEIAWEKRF